MICGYNWGGDPSDPGRSSSRSFFSDVHDGNRYRNRIIRWFELWGHPLVRDVGNETWFERSIVQTNWLPTQSKSLKGMQLAAECIRCWSDFALLVEHFRPRLLLLMGSRLIDALNFPVCQERMGFLLGKPGAVTYEAHNETVNGHPLRKFKVYFQNFGTTSVVCLPHPTGSRGLHDQYVASFSSKIGGHIAAFKHLVVERQ